MLYSYHKIKGGSRGSALLIVLAFLLLLTTVTVAFLSRATFERQLSNASYSQGKVDFAGQGAIASIIGDLQQEIIAGSNVGAGTNIPDLTQGGTVTGYYYPNSPTNVVPALVVPGYTSSSIVGTGMEDLLKVSKSGQSFFPSGGSYSNGTPSNRASGVNSYSNSSINGRFITPVRWNKPLLLSRNLPTSTSDFTPVTTFPVPDWIYVARDGSNPTGTTLDSSYVFSSSVMPTANPLAGKLGTNAVLQRYGYAIYDEGSTLDLNVAGSPSGSASVSYSALQPYKTALSYADLTQLPGISGLTAPNQAAFVNSIVGWRNFSSGLLSQTSKFPNTYTFTSTGFSAFDQLVAFNPSGFMTAGSSIPLTSTPASSPPLRYGPNAATSGGQQDQSDNAYAGRQQLLQFMLVGLGQNSTFTGKVPLITLINIMPYLGTFSRDISQPSYAPSPTRPLIVGAAAGGGNDAYGLDTAINPPFLGITVKTAGWSRNDGTLTVVGEPLVKKRFALSRLAWITYKGPSADRANVANPSSTVGNVDYDLYQLEHKYNIPVSFLQQGTDANVKAYFGLVWNNAGYWTYQPTSGSTSTISNLTAVNNLGREPNFIELLKAGIIAGSIAKDFPTDISDTQQNYQYTSINCSILQIAVNIIDQATCDGYPTQIQFTSSGHTYPIFGVKNLPYFYRVRNATLTTTLPTTIPANLIYPPTAPHMPQPVTGTWTGTLSGNGQFTVLQEPEIWNPHGWNPNDNTTGYGTGSPAPQYFQLTASAQQACTVTPTAQGTSPTTPVPTASPIMSGTLTFRVPQNAAGAGLYREPTLLIANGIPTNSSLSGTTVAAYGAPYCYNGDFPSNIVNAMSAPTGTQTNNFTGFVVGAGTLCWTSGSGANVTLYVANSSNLSPASNLVTYTLSCNSPGSTSANGIPFDTKIGNTIGGTTDYMINASGAGNQLSSMLDTYFSGTENNLAIYVQGGYLDHMIPTGIMYDVFDPRTGRFGMTSAIGSLSISTRNERFGFPPRYSLNTPCSRWVSPQQNITESDRPDNYAGYGYGTGDTSVTDPSFPPNNADGWSWGLSVSNSNGPQFYHGLFEQNNLNFNNYDNGWVNEPFYTSPNASTSPEYYADPDGVVRRATGGYVLPILPQASSPSSGTLASASGAFTVGLPMATSVAYDNSANATPITTGTLVAPAVPPGGPYVNYAPGSVPGSAMLMCKSDTGQYTSATTYNVNMGTIFSRPIILNRPFRTVGELGYVFSGTPWKNLDLMSQESGFGGLMDVFCINDTNDPQSLIAGKVNLNTRQAATLQAVLASAYIDNYGMLLPSLSANVNANGTLSTLASSSLAQALVARTTSTSAGAGPLVNLSELAGKWLSPSSPVKDSSGNYDGTSTTNFSGPGTDMTGLSSFGANDCYLNNIERFREAPVRALAAAGTTRVWNLMIDVIAQTGRFPSSASTLANFNVEGERRYWVHVAIDRYTGRVLDEQVEEVKE